LIILAPGVLKSAFHAVFEKIEKEGRTYEVEQKV
jgi:hypothetical protein